MNTINSEHPSLYLKLIIWLNIFLQVLFPVAVTCTPLIAAANNTMYTTTNQQQLKKNTQIYTIGQYETIFTVATKFNITADELFELNHSYHLKHEFFKLGVGDKIRVPLTTPNEQIQSIKFAQYATQFGSALSDNSTSDATQAIARSIVGGMANDQVQQWLSRFGTARVKLDVDKHFSLKNSQIDLLIPWHEQNNQLFFTQGSLHRTDDRTQSNLGIGYRKLNDSWLFGANVFLDYDLSRDHARWGLGMEYWRDYFKVGVNGYFRLTQWKNSPDFDDYYERPANGFDVRAQAWLPRFPQLGGTLKYEHYYGDKVALISKDKQQRNPHAITFGVNYTPFPMLTFSAEHRQSQSGNNNLFFGVNVNYQLGTPWRNNIDPNSVAAMRSLIGSRYDLVERNNNIVLEYQEKDLIALHTADAISGYAGEQKSLNVSVNSKYELDRIDWSAASLIAAGGDIIKNGNDYDVILPTFHSASGANNTYMISAIALDKRGHYSKRSNTLITVVQAAIDSTQSTLTPTQISLPADGVSTQQLRLNINDNEGNPIDVDENEIRLDKIAKLRVASTAHVTSFSRQKAGEYVAIITAGTSPESFTLTPIARNTRLASADVAFVADNTTAQIDRLEVITDNAIADGKAKNKVKLWVVDAYHNPVKTQKIDLQVNNQATVNESIITDDNGEAVVNISHTKAGVTILTASIHQTGHKQINVTFIADKDTAQINNDDLTITPEISVADGNTAKTVTVRVTDLYANPVPQINVMLAVNNNATLAQQSITTNDDGVASTYLTSQFAGLTTVSATVNQKVTSRSTQFTGDKATAIVSSVTTDSQFGIADGQSTVVFKALVKDVNGNILPNVPVDWTSNKDDSLVMFNQLQSLTNDSGMASVQVSSKKSYQDVVITAFTNASSKSSDPFTYKADSQNAVITLFSSDKQKLTADGQDRAELSIKVTDLNGNALDAMTVSLSGTNQTQIDKTQLITDKNGQATTTFTTTLAGALTITAKLDNQQQKTLSLNAAADAKTATVSITTSSSTAVAGQTAPIIVTANVVDANNNPVPDLSVTWQADYNQLSDFVSITNKQGEAVTNLSGTQAITTTITAILPNSQRNTATVTFTSAPAVQKNSELKVNPQSITADGQAKALATLSLKDEWNNPVLDQNITWRAATESGIKFVAKVPGQGVYLADVTGLKEGTWQLNALSGDVNLNTELALLASQDSASLKTVTVSGLDTVKADGVETVILQAQVSDENGNTKLKGVAVGWDSSLGTFSSRISYTDENGLAQITLSSRQAGQAQVTAMLGGGQPVKADKKVTFTTGKVDKSQSLMSLSPASIVASKENATLIITAKDAQGNNISGLQSTITLSFTTDLKLTHTAFTEVSSGIYQSTISAQKAGDTVISAIVDGIALEQTATLAVTADTTSAKINGDISVTPTSAIVEQHVTYSAKFTDKYGNTLGSGIPITWSANDGSLLDSPVTYTNNLGIATVTLTRFKMGIAKVNVVLPSATTAAPDVTFVAGIFDEGHSDVTLSPSTIIAGKETAILSLTLRDKNDNLLIDQRVSGKKLSGDATISISSSEQDEQKPGQYFMTVSGQKMGNATLTVVVNNTAFSQTKSLTVKGDTDNWTVSQVTANKSSIIAGDSQGITYQATVTDKLGNVLPNVVVSWQLSGLADNFEPTSRTDEKGIASMTITSHKVGRLVMTAWLDKNNSRQANAVDVLAADIDSDHSTFNSDKTIIGSDGKEAVTLTVHLEDKYANPIADKQVTINGANSLTGFTLSDVTYQGNGNYTAQGTSIKKGRVTLNANVGNLAIGKSITVTIGAINPELRFANELQQTTWTKSFTDSQAVQGMPDGVIQMWSSSDEDIATVSSKGSVTLLKAGEVKITVYTPGNAQYNPAMASYTLNISKAKPELVFGDGEHQTTYGSNFVLPTVKNTNNQVDLSDLTLTYRSSSPAVSTIDDKGKITVIKAGSVTYYANTTGDERYEAAQTQYILVINKAKLSISFSDTQKSVNVVQMAANQKVYWQEPIQSFMPEAVVKVSSTNDSVLKVDADGTVKSYSPGTTRIKLSVVEDERFEASSGDYDLNIFGRPVMTITSLQGTSLNEQVNVTQQDWQPYLTDDKLQIDWKADVDPYYLPKKVIVTIFDGNTVLDSQTYNAGSTSSGSTTIIAKSSLVGKTLTVDVKGYGYADIQSDTTSKTVVTSVVNINKILSSATAILKHEVFIWDGSKDSQNTCRTSGFVGRRDVYLSFDVALSPKYAQKKTIFGHDISLSINNSTRKNTGSWDRWTRSMSSVSNSGSLLFKSGGSGVHANTQLAYDCWANHLGGMDDQGTVRAILDVSYGGKSFTLESYPMTWSGDSGASNQSSVNFILP